MLNAFWNIKRDAIIVLVKPVVRNCRCFMHKFFIALHLQYFLSQIYIFWFIIFRLNHLFRSNIAIDFIVILLETIKLALQNKQPLRFSSKDIYFKGNENVVYVIQNVKWWRREKQFSRHKTFVIWRSKDSLSLSDGKYQIALDFWCLKYPQIYFSVLLYFSDISNKSIRGWHMF